MEIPIDKPLWRQYLRPLAVITICLMLVLTGLVFAKHALRTPLSARQLALTTIEHAPLQNKVSAFGQLAPAKVHSLIAMVDGRVQQIDARPGQMVSAGQPLLKLVNPRLQRLLEEQQLALQSQQAEVMLVAQQLAQEALQLKHDQLLAAGELKLLETQLKAKQQLFQQQIVSALDFAQSQVLVEQAQQKLQLATEKLHGFSSSRQNRQQAAELQLQRVQKQFAIASQDVDALQIAADFTGQLIALDETLKPGSRVEMGQALGLVAKPDALVAELKIAAVDAATVKLGQQVRVNIKGKPMPGVISWISPNISDNFMRLDVELQGTLPDTARANIEVNAEIQAAEFPAGPLSARPAYINSSHRRYPIFVLNPTTDVFERREVQVGEISQRQMQLLAGGAIGEQLLLTVPSRLLDQASIKPEDLDDRTTD